MGQTGRQRAKVFDTLTAAKTHVRLIEADKHRGDYIDPNLTRTPFRKVAEAWLATGPAQKERTRIGYAALTASRRRRFVSSSAISKRAAQHRPPSGMLYGTS